MVTTEGTQHQDHERLALVIPTWFTRSSPEMGYVVEPRPFSFYIMNPKTPRLTRWALVRNVGPGDVPGFLDDVHEHFGSFPVKIVIDNRQLDAQIGLLLVAAGCPRGVRTNLPGPCRAGSSDFRGSRPRDRTGQRQVESARLCDHEAQGVC